MEHGKHGLNWFNGFERIKLQTPSLVYTKGRLREIGYKEERYKGKKFLIDPCPVTPKKEGLRNRKSIHCHLWSLKHRKDCLFLTSNSSPLPFSLQVEDPACGGKSLPRSCLAAECVAEIKSLSFRSYATD